MSRMYIYFSIYFIQILHTVTLLSPTKVKEKIKVCAKSCHVSNKCRVQM